VFPPTIARERLLDFSKSTCIQIVHLWKFLICFLPPNSFWEYTSLALIFLVQFMTKSCFHTCCIIRLRFSAPEFLTAAGSIAPKNKSALRCSTKKPFQALTARQSSFGCTDMRPQSQSQSPTRIIPHHSSKAHPDEARHASNRDNRILSIKLQLLLPIFRWSHSPYETFTLCSFCNGGIPKCVLLDEKTDASNLISRSAFGQLLQKLTSIKTIQAVKPMD